MFLIAALLQVVSAGSLPVLTVAQGFSSQILEPRHLVVHSADEWATLWKTHSTDPVPAVDFRDATVIAVFMGVQPSAGYSIEIAAVRAVDARTVVDYVERHPAPDAMTAQMLTSPFHIVKIARRSGAVEFRRVVAVRR